MAIETTVERDIGGREAAINYPLREGGKTTFHHRAKARDVKVLFLDVLCVLVLTVDEIPLADTAVE
jgi:hypothetical protein